MRLRIVIGDGDANRVAVLWCRGGIIVQVSVRQGEALSTNCTGGQTDCLGVIWAQRFAPINQQGEGIQSPWVGHRTSQHRHAVFVDRNDRIQRDYWSDVIDRHCRLVGVDAAVVVSDGQRIHIAGRIGGVVVEVLSTGCERPGFGVHRGIGTRPVAPGHDDGVRVETAQVGKGTGERGRAIFVDDWSIEALDHWGDVIDSGSR